MGRTGTIILSDICLRMVAKEKRVDVLYHLYKLREQRPNMVDNAEQYKLVHLLLLECLFAPNTTLKCDSTIKTKVEEIISSGGIRKQMQYLESTAWYDDAMKMSFEDDDENMPNYPEKNRFQDIVPG